VALIALLFCMLLPSNPSLGEVVISGCADGTCDEHDINDRIAVWESKTGDGDETEVPIVEVVTAKTTASSVGLPSIDEQSNPPTPSVEELIFVSTTPIEVVTTASGNSSLQTTKVAQQAASFLSKYWWVFFVPLAIPFLVVLIMLLCKLCRGKRTPEDEESSAGHYEVEEETRAVIVSEVVSVPAEPVDASNEMTG